MNIYFIASPRAIVNDKVLFKKIYDHLAKDNRMLSNLVLEVDNNNVDSFYSASHEQRIAHYKRTIQAVKDADIVVVDVSLHSMSMGFIVNKALELGKPVTVIHPKDNPPYFFSGIESDRLIVVGYKSDNVLSVVDGAIKTAKSLMDVRFNFFVNQKHLNYLDYVAKNRMIPRSVFLRDLIEREIKKDKSYLVD